MGMLPVLRSVCHQLPKGHAMIYTDKNSLASRFAADDVERREAINQVIDAGATVGMLRSVSPETLAGVVLNLFGQWDAGYVCSVNGCRRAGDPAADGGYRCERHPWV